MVWQRAGTVSVQNGNTTVTGAGVDFAASSRVGDSFIGPDGASYEVANIASDTVISILPAYKGATVSGAAYAIMPVQGYDKMLSDAFNSLNNQFGPKLAALGTTGNYETLPVAKGGTGGNTQASARAALGVDVTLASAILDPASGGLMSSSVVSGFTIVKFANGIMCMMVALPDTAQIAANGSLNSSVTIPSGFISAAAIYPQVIATGATTVDHYGVGNYYVANSTSFNFGIKNGATAQAFQVRAIVWGRWK